MTELTFLSYHYVQFIDAWKDGILRKVYFEDLSFDISAVDMLIESVTAIYCIVNDLDDRMVPELVKTYNEYRAKHPRPVPKNIQLGDN